MVALGNRPERVGGRRETDDILTAATGNIGTEGDTRQRAQRLRHGQAERNGKFGIQPDALPIHAGTPVHDRDNTVKGGLLRVRADRQVALIPEGTHNLGGAPLPCPAEQQLEPAGSGQHATSPVAGNRLRLGGRQNVHRLRRRVDSGFAQRQGIAQREIPLYGVQGASGGAVRKAAFARCAGGKQVAGVADRLVALCRRLQYDAKIGVNVPLLRLYAQFGAGAL